MDNGRLKVYESTDLLSEWLSDDKTRIDKLKGIFVALSDWSRVAADMGVGLIPAVNIKSKEHLVTYIEQWAEAGATLGELKYIVCKTLKKRCYLDSFLISLKQMEAVEPFTRIS